MGEFAVSLVCLPKTRWLGGTPGKWFNILDLPHAVLGASVSSFKGRSAVGHFPRLQSSPSRSWVPTQLSGGAPMWLQAILRRHQAGRPFNEHVKETRKHFLAWTSIY